MKKLFQQKWSTNKKKNNLWPTQESRQSILPTHLISSQGHFFYLLHFLLTLLLIYPYLETSGYEKVPKLLILLKSILIVSIIDAVCINKRQFIFASLLGIPCLALMWLDFPFSEISFMFFMGLLYVYAILLTIPYILHAENVKEEKLYAVCSLYIIIGLFWANLYEAIEFFYPNSFYVHATHNIDGVLNWSDYVFFSFTTLTTLGYGNMAPISSPARSLAIVEAFTGVVFLAIMVSRSIGFYISHSLRDSLLSERDSRPSDSNLGNSGKEDKSEMP